MNYNELKEIVSMFPPQPPPRDQNLCGCCGCEVEIQYTSKMVVCPPCMDKIQKWNPIPREEASHEQ
jgi:hypothetical protein